MAETGDYIQESRRDVSPQLQRSMSYIAMGEWTPGEEPWFPDLDKGKLYLGDIAINEPYRAAA